MSRRIKLVLNSSCSIIYQLISVICGFILPRAFLTYYGSSVNGLVSSITHFLGFITLLDLGVGAVVQSSLYKPLAERNNDEISRIFISSRRFFRRIAYILLVYIVALIIIFPFAVTNEFGFLYTALLIVAISISSFAQYFFGMTYQLLLNADQMSFVRLIIQSVVVIANTIVSVLLIQNGFSIHFVKLVSSIIFLITPLALKIYVDKHYSLDLSIKLTSEPIKQKWNGLAQHIAYIIHTKTDIAVLTIMTSLINVSIYNVYHMVVNGVHELVVAGTVGIKAMLGNMYANNEKEVLDKTFSSVEWFLHTITTFMYTMTGVLIVPFVCVYTEGVTDANYNVPLFGMLITIAQALLCIQLPYNTMVQAAGHFKQTQWSSIIEAGINITISVLFVHRLGLVGVAIGTIAAMFYRATYLAWYLSKNILNRNIIHYIVHLAVDSITVIAVFLITNIFKSFFTLSAVSYLAWLVLAIKVGVVCVLVCIFVNFLFYRKIINTTIMLFMKRKDRKI